MRELIQKGDRYFLRKDHKSALVYFEQALQSDPDDPTTNYKAGISSIDQKQFQRAVEYLSRAFQLNAEVSPDIRYHLGIAYQNVHRYGEALHHFETLRGREKRLASIVTSRISECLAGDTLMQVPPTGRVHLLDGGINTAFSEFAPLISSDGGALLFSSNRSTDPYQVKSRTNFDNVYVSQGSGSRWSNAEKMPAIINVPSNNVATSISGDGTTLLLYYEEGGGDIYTSTLDNGVWSKPVPLNRFINHPQYCESAAAISHDGKYLYFSSNRPGGKGGFDIYVSEMGQNGEWGRPLNLGSRVNSRKDETSPFIHADGKTLYFSSNGHATLGDHDLYRTVLHDGQWTTPHNLGYPVNTSAYEGFMVVSQDGSHGYFTSRRKPGQADTDIYHVTFLLNEVVQSVTHEEESQISEIDVIE